MPSNIKSDLAASNFESRILHRNICEAIVNSLKEVFENNKYADKVIEKTLKSNPKWGSRDRKFIAESVYEIVRWYRLLQFSSNTNQHDYWQLLGTWLLSDGVNLPPWEEFNSLDINSLRNNHSKAIEIRKIRESIPDWLDELGEKELQEKWDKELEALNETAVVVLRCNNIKTNIDTLQKLLLSKGIETSKIATVADALVLKKRQNIFSLPEFQSGYFEVQDAGSQLIAPFLDIQPGMRIIDACAGAGGKSLHIAALMQNKGKLISMDVEQYKLLELQKRAKRAGISLIETKLIESNKTIKRLENSADRLLLDVPCSGLGVLKRNPDAKWKLSLNAISEVKAKQEEILLNYSSMLKSKGLMLYATCSILPSENKGQIEKFLTKKSTEFTLLSEKQIWPSDGYDGFYMALLQKN